MTNPIRTRRPPPQFRRADVVAATWRSPRLAAFTLAGPELIGFDDPEPAASVRLLLPRGGAGEALEMPTWNGNEFTFADGTRPPIRTLTPLRTDAVIGQVAIEVVVHGDGALSRWAAAAPLGETIALSGPGAGYAPPPDATQFLLLGDESALPAIGQLLTVLPDGATIDVVVEVADRQAIVALPTHPGVTTQWLSRKPTQAPGATLLAAAHARTMADDLVVWAAGEAAAMQALRRAVITEAGLPRHQTSIRGYWKHGRDGAGTSQATNA